MDALSPDTEAVLLLCGRFGGESNHQAKPLTPTEYQRLIQWLLERALRPRDLLQGNLDDLTQADLLTTRVTALMARGTALAFALEKWQRCGLWVLSRSDAAYPQRLKKKLGSSAPPLLYGAGDPSLLSGGGLAIVGSRHTAQAALEYARDVGRACADDGLAVISGGAAGVDAAAMQGAGEAEGVVIGVLAADLLRTSVHPQNRGGISSGKLALVSAASPEAHFHVVQAMSRNRYIYTLADQALVVDSVEKSGGTWAGATENLRQGWTPLFVRIPSESGGNTALLSRGAQIFTHNIAGGALRLFLESATHQPNQATLFPV